MVVLVRLEFERDLIDRPKLVPWIATTATFRPLIIAQYYGTMDYLMPR